MVKGGIAQPNPSPAEEWNDAAQQRQKGRICSCSTIRLQQVSPLWKWNSETRHKQTTVQSGGTERVECSISAVERWSQIAPLTAASARALPRRAVVVCAAAAAAAAARAI